MKFVRESQAPKESFEAPYKRIITHLIAPWTVGSKHVWMGICEYPAGSVSNPHAHDEMEETFYCIAGQGQIKVDDTVFDVTVGDAVYVEPGETHQCINTNGSEPFKLVAVVTPPFTPQTFSEDHKAKG